MVRTRIRRWLRSPLWRMSVDREVAHDLDSHLEMRIAEYVASGMEPEAAREKALRRFGDREQIEQSCREIARGRNRRWRLATWFEEGRQDLGYTFRQLTRSPGFTMTTVLVLSLGIGANTAIFSVVRDVLLRPLPYADPDRVVQLVTTLSGSPITFISYAYFTDVGARSETFAEIAAYRPAGATMLEGEAPERQRVGTVSASFFEVLGVQPAYGRFFLPPEGEPGHDPIVVLSWGFWQQRFGGDPGIVGKTINLDGTEHTVIGVTRADFESPFGLPPLWRTGPPWFGDDPERRDNRSWRAIARVRPEVSLAAAQAEIDVIAASLAEEYPEAHTGEGVLLITVMERMVGWVRPALRILFAAVVLVLLIACANVANLLLSRASVRQPEIAIRMALGAGRRRLVGQLLTESLVFSMLGGAAGLALAWVGMRYLIALTQQVLPRSAETRLDGQVLLFTLGVTVVTAVVFGLVPAVRATRPGVGFEPVRRGTTAGREKRTLRSALVVAEIALSVVLVIGAALLVKSLWNLGHEETGIAVENLLTFQITPQEDRHPGPEGLTRLYQELTARLAALPGVEDAAATTSLPLSGSFSCEDFTRDDQPQPEPGQRQCAQFRSVTPDYFRTMGMTLLAGRGATGDADARPVVVINKTMAERVFPGEDPIGRSVTIRGTSREIVGIVNDVKLLRLAMDPTMGFYVPYAQLPVEGQWLRRTMSLVVRTSSDPLRFSQAVRDVVGEVDATLAIVSMRTMENVVRGNTAGARWRTLLLAVFASVALVLAAVGTAGVMAYSVSQRLAEIGVRMALGARQRDVFRLVVGQGMKLSLLGLGIGLVAALASSRLLASLLFGVAATDPTIYAVVALLLVTVAAGACYFPARRATRVDPITVLSAE